jgi:hypothetical protein
MRGLLFVAAVGALVSTPVAAETPKSYFCEVTNIYELSDSGVLQSSGGLDVLIKKQNNRFQININTGEMTGTLFSSSNWARTSVLDSGTSPSGSFLKVMYSSPPGGEFTNVGYLEIQGRIDQPSRPFLYEVGGELYSGVCRAAF